MTEHAPDRIWTGIDIPKTIAGVLATVSAAVLGSFLGVAGTLVGAALASVIGTIGTEVYHRSISKGARKLQSSFVAAPAAVGTPSVAAARSEVPSESEVPEPPRTIRWGRVGAVAASVFVLAIGTLTAFELITGKSASDAVGHKSSSSTTVGSLLDGHKATPTPTPVDSAPATSATPTDTTATTPAPAATATTTAPTSPAPTATTDATTQPAQTGAPAADNTQNPQQQGVG
jgi:hypothetical protein